MLPWKGKEHFGENDLMELLHEKETIQKCLKDPQSKRETGMVSRKFAAVMRKTKANAAINLLFY